MDFFGSSKKINRYVYKALRLSPNGLNFGKIDQFVKYCNRNLNPVGNMSDKVKNSLRNYERYGIVRKYGNNYHLIFDDSKNEVMDNKNTERRHRFDDQLYEADAELRCNSNFMGDRIYDADCQVNYAVPENKVINDCTNYELMDNDVYRTKSLSSIAPPDQKKKKRKGIECSDNDDDDEANVETHRKRRKIVTVLDGRTDIKQGNSAKSDPKAYPKDILFLNKPPEAGASGIKEHVENISKPKKKYSDDKLDVISVDEITGSPNIGEGSSIVNNQNQFENAENDLLDEIKTSKTLFQRTNSYFYLN